MTFYKKIAVLIVSITALSNLYANDGWIITATDTSDYHQCFVGNGIIGIRTNKSGLKTNEVYINGFYDCEPGGYASLVSFYRPLNIEVSIKGIGEVLFNKSVTNWQQSINLKEAILYTDYKYAGKLAIHERLMALRNNPMCAMNCLDLEALEDVELTIENKVSIPDRSNIKGTYSQTLGFKKYKDIPVMYALIPSLSGHACVAGANTYYFGGTIPEYHYLKTSDNSQKISFNINLKKGQKYTFCVVSSIVHDGLTKDPFNDALRVCAREYSRGYDFIIEQHKNKWKDIWQDDIEIEGDDLAQRDVRVALYSLYSSITEGSGLSIPPCGLSSDAWGGHIFWDAELWMYPALLVMKPSLAKQMLDFRINTAPQCRKRAALYGYKGIMFPWESDMDGNECCPVKYKLDMNEHHITADVGIAFWNYYLVTQDKKWLQQKGYPMLKEVADFWTSRATQDNSGKCHILNVIGPDEYHEDIDDNAFTNGAAKFCLLAATQAAAIVNEVPDQQWNLVADRLVVLKFPNGVTQQYDKYKGEIIKQADVNLLSFPLNIINDNAQILKDLNFYQSRIDTNGPAMSNCALATISARLGDIAKAEELYDKSYKPNLKKPFYFISESPNNTNMTFCTGYGGMLQTILFGFGGLNISPQGLVQEKSVLPKQWKSLKIKTENKIYEVMK